VREYVGILTSAQAAETCSRAGRAVNGARDPGGARGASGWIPPHQTPRHLVTPRPPGRRPGHLVDAPATSSTPRPPRRRPGHLVAPRRARSHPALPRCASSRPGFPRPGRVASFTALTQRIDDSFFTRQTRFSTHSLLRPQATRSGSKRPRLRRSCFPVNRNTGRHGQQQPSRLATIRSRLTARQRQLAGWASGWTPPFD
jgi:hypothetical protein